jgi:hypothetical protein
MILALLGFDLFLILIIALELYTGFAWCGWTGDNMVIEKEKHPGPYWLTIGIHLFILIALPILATLAYAS